MSTDFVWVTRTTNSTSGVSSTAAGWPPQPAPEPGPIHDDWCDHCGCIMRPSYDECPRCGAPRMKERLP